MQMEKAKFWETVRRAWMKQEASPGSEQTEREAFLMIVRSVEKRQAVDSSCKKEGKSEQT
jgi:hypothetical protein